MNSDNIAPVKQASFGSFLKGVWTLAIPYFRSQEWKSAWGLLALVIGANMTLVWINVLLNYWNNAFYDTLQNLDFNAFVQLLLTWRPGEHGIFGIQLGFTILAFTYIIVAIYATYLSQWLQIRWRRWLTEKFLDEWTAEGVHYRMAMTTTAGQLGTDNPDQRIAEDVRDFVTLAVTLTVDFLSNVVQMASFIAILWTLSGPITLFGWTIPGYLVFFCLVYAVIGTLFTHFIGRPLGLLRFVQQKVEADFRYGLMRFRENSEGIALYHGEADERQDLLARFKRLQDNWWDLMSRIKKLNALTSGYGQIAIIFPYAVAAPRFFGGAIKLGGLMQIANAFGQVQGSMSWFVTSYANLMQWRAIVARLTTFQKAMAAAQAAKDQGIIVNDNGDTAVVIVKDMTLELPTGVRLLEKENVTFWRGKSVVVTGASGSGKSTLFRAIAGIWPFGSGNVVRNSERCMFLPQRPYIPLGTLARVVAFPMVVSHYTREDIAAALTDAGLPHLIGELDNDDTWATRLSGGEQQRVALARALLYRPDFLFLDEATASLDPEAEAHLYKTIKTRLPNATIISIAHRPAVAQYHDEKLVVVKGENGRPGKLVPASIDGDKN